MDEYDITREYYWTEMYYNLDKRNNDKCADIYNDMEWWYLYQLEREDEYEEYRQVDGIYEW